MKCDDVTRARLDFEAIAQAFVLPDVALLNVDRVVAEDSNPEF